jgi:hypothetical protein
MLVTNDMIVIEIIERPIISYNTIYWMLSFKQKLLISQTIQYSLSISLIDFKTQLKKILEKKTYNQKMIIFECN